MFLAPAYKANIKKISNYVVKKVAESLKKLFNKDREKYESIWKDSGLFVKYGCVSDDKFDEAMRDRIIFETGPDKEGKTKYLTIPEYRETLPETYQEKLGDKVLYYEKDKFDYSVRAQLAEAGLLSLEMDEYIDPHFMQHAETKKVGERGLQFASIDSEISNLLESEATNESDIKVQELFKNILLGDKKEEDPDAVVVEVQKLKGAKTPAYFKVDEQMKRFQKMAKSMGNDQMAFPVKKTLVINPGNELIQNALKLHEKGENTDLVEKLVHYVEDLASISSEGLKNEDKELFVMRSQSLIQDLTNKMN